MKRVSKYLLPHALFCVLALMMSASPVFAIDVIDHPHQGTGSAVKPSGARTPPDAPSPGDEKTYAWTECKTPDSGPCTRHHRTDRWQRKGAPITPDALPRLGDGAFAWVAVKWGSTSCANAKACRSVKHADLSSHENLQAPVNKSGASAIR